MSEFKSLAIAKYLRADVWAAMRDALCDVAPHLGDIERIVVESREERADGTLYVVNRWHAKAPIPAALSSLIKPEMLAWTDHALWDPREHVCRFRIEPAFFPDRARMPHPPGYRNNN